LLHTGLKLKRLTTQWNSMTNSRNITGGLRSRSGLLNTLVLKILLIQGRQDRCCATGSKRSLTMRNPISVLKKEECGVKRTDVFISLLKYQR